MTHSNHSTALSDNQDFKNQLLSSDDHPFICQIKDLIAYHPSTPRGDKMQHGFDVLVAKYRLEFRNSANYIEKIEVAKNQNLDQLKSRLSELSDFNERDYNIYIRPHHYPNNDLMVFDDYVSSSNAESLSNEIIYQKGVNPDLMSLSFSLQTSIHGDKKNYQLGFTLNPAFALSQKSQFLTWACKELGCDPRHAVSVGKYFRAAGFLNKKFKEVTKKIEVPVHKNHTVLYHSYELNRDLVLKKDEDRGNIGNSAIRLEHNRMDMTGSINAINEINQINQINEINQLEEKEGLINQAPQIPLTRKNKF